MGADGVLIPRTETFEQIETAINSIRMYPFFEDENSPVDKRIANAKIAALVPCVAWNTDVAITAIHEEGGDNIVRYLKGERPESVVNKI